MGRKWGLWATGGDAGSGCKISNWLFALKPGILYMEKRILFRGLAIVDYNIYFSTAFGLINHSN
jgi:hypothetical protein